jgi:site-specific recombinase XerD
VEQWLDFRSALGATHDSPWLSLHHGGGDRQEQLAPLSFRTFGRSLARDLDPYWKWHRLRHTAATEWLRAGVPIEKVRRFMGHSNIEQTLAYTEILSGDMATAFDEAHARFAANLRLPMAPDEKAA